MTRFAFSRTRYLGQAGRAKAGIGSAINDSTRLVGGTLGVAVIGSVYASVYASRLTAAMPAAVPSSAAAAAFLPAQPTTQAAHQAGQRAASATSVPD